MKHVKLFEQFLNEKVYQLAGFYNAKGVPGKVLFAFKKGVERIKYDGNVDSTLAEINKVWKKWADVDGAKIIETEVMKIVKDKEAVAYIIATLSESEWIADTANGINSPDGNELFITLDGDFVINVGFNDDVDANKFYRRLGGIQNTAMDSGSTTVFGAYSDVGNNNIEIRENMFLSIDAK